MGGNSGVFVGSVRVVKKMSLIAQYQDLQEWVRKGAQDKANYTWDEDPFKPQVAKERVFVIDVPDVEGKLTVTTDGEVERKLTLDDLFM